MISNYKIRALYDLLFTLIGMVGITSSASAEISGNAADTCAKVLSSTTKAVTIKSLSKRAQMAWMKSVDSSTFDQSRSALNLIIPDLGDGSFSDFDEKRKSHFQKENYESNNFEAAQEFISESKDAIQAWSKCMMDHAGGLFTYVKDLDEEGGTIVLTWKRPEGVGDITTVSIETTGIQDGNFKNLSKIDEGDVAFILRRIEKNRAMRGVVNARTGGPHPSSKTVLVYVPSKVPDPHVLHISEAYLYGNDGQTRVTALAAVRQQCEGKAECTFSPLTLIRNYHSDPHYDPMPEHHFGLRVFAECTAGNDKKPATTSPTYRPEDYNEVQDFLVSCK